MMEDVRRKNWLKPVGKSSQHLELLLDMQFLLLPLADSHLKHVIESKDHQYFWSFKKNLQKSSVKISIFLRCVRVALMKPTPTL